MFANLPEKLALTLFLVILSITAPPVITFPVFIGVLFLRKIIPALRPTTTSGARRFSTMLRYFTGLAVLMTVLNGILIREGNVIIEVAGISLFRDGILFGIRTAARLLLISTALLVFFGSTDIAHIAAFLNRVGLPAQIVMSLLLTLYFLESLPSRMNRIFDAQQARGAPIQSGILSRGRAFFSILSPLVLSSLVESIDRGMALELRGYHSGTRLTFDKTEKPALTLTAVIFLVLSMFALSLPWVLP